MGGLPDMQVPEVGREHLAGNLVLLRCAEAKTRADVLLGHLRRYGIYASAQYTASLIAGARFISSMTARTPGSGMTTRSGKRSSSRSSSCPADEARALASDDSLIRNKRRPAGCSMMTTLPRDTI